MYQVSLKEQVPQYSFPISVRELSTIEGTLHIPDKKAIVRDDNNQVLGIVSDNYNVLPHNEALDPIIESLSKSCPNIHKSILLTKNGARMYANLYLKDFQGVISVDDIWPGVTIVNSLDGSKKYQAELSMFRLVCTNGMTIPQTVASFATRHSKNATYDAAIDEILRIIENPDTFSFVNELNRREGPPKRDSEILTNEIVSVCEADGSNFPKRYSDRVADYYVNYESGVSLWNFYNAFNSVLEHEMIREKGKVERARSLDLNLYSTFEKIYLN